MRTVRRLYFYAVALVSLEVVLWGLINLLRSMFCPVNAACGFSTVLAQGLALTLVGVPVFGFHWWWAQRASARDSDEHSSGVRAVFLYGTLLGTLIPAIQNLIALVNRPALVQLGLQGTRAYVGGQQLWTDNVIAILMNLLVAFYFFRVLRQDWKVIQPSETFASVRRIYRTIWVLYGLGLTVSGVQQLLYFIILNDPSLAFRYYAVNGLVVTLVGTPVWVYTWLTTQKAQAEPDEAGSPLRLGLLYFLSLAGAASVLSTGGVVLYTLLRLIFGFRPGWGEFLAQMAGPLSLLIPMAGVWAYYGHWLDQAIASSGDELRRAGMRRLYAYILSALGLGATFAGLAFLLSFVVDAAIGNLVWADTLAPRLAQGLATLLVGLPLWLVAWRPMQAEALAPGEAGDHARRSLLRKIYLYLVLFISVVGGMFTAFTLLNLLLRSLLGTETPIPLQGILKSIEVLILFVGMGVYHGLSLGRDGKMEASSLADKHADFPVLVFDSADGSFGPALLAALQSKAPRLPVTLLAAAQTPQGGALPKAVVLPSDLALDPPPALRKWLEPSTGVRLLVPHTGGDWVNTAGTRPLAAAAGQAAQVIRQLAEGGEARPQGPAPAWLIVVYVLAGLIGIPLLIALIGSLTSSLFR